MLGGVVLSDGTAFAFGIGGVKGVLSFVPEGSVFLVLKGSFGDASSFFVGEGGIVFHRFVPGFEAVFLVLIIFFFISSGEGLFFDVLCFKSL